MGNTFFQNLKNSLSLVVANLNVGKARRVFSKGREYLVAPASMIVPGVLNGSQGALYYHQDECSKNPQAWNNIPLTLRHPSDPITNMPLSASGEGVIERQGLGTTKNTRWENGKLRSEAWFDVKDTQAKAPEVYNKLINHQPIELSTGLYTDNVPMTGNCPKTGRPYDHLATNFRPDHLAVLPDQKGACSNDDGCGILVNSNPEGINQYSASASSAKDASKKASDLTRQLDLGMSSRFQTSHGKATSDAMFHGNQGEHARAAAAHGRAAKVLDALASTGRSPSSGEAASAHRTAQAAHRTALKFKTTENAHPEGINQEARPMTFLDQVLQNAFSPRHLQTGQFLPKNGPAVKQTTTAAQQGHGTLHENAPDDEEDDDGDLEAQAEERGMTVDELKDQLGLNAATERDVRNMKNQDNDARDRTIGDQGNGVSTDRDALDHEEDTNYSAMGGPNALVDGDGFQAGDDHQNPKHGPAELRAKAKKLGIKTQNAMPMPYMPEGSMDRHSTSQMAAMSSMEHPDAREHAMGALDASKGKNSGRASKGHLEAAQVHEDAATEARKGEDQQTASDHDRAAALHRKAASMHSATINEQVGHFFGDKAELAGGGGAETSKAMSASDKAASSGSSKHHAAAASDHRAAAEHHGNEGNLEHANAHSSAAKYHDRKAKTTQNQQQGGTMTREHKVAWLTANCKCDKEKKAFPLLNNDTLDLVFNAKAEGSNADVAGSGTDQAGGEEDANDESAGPSRPGTKIPKGVNLKTAPPQTNADAVVDRIVRNEHKKLIGRLTSHIADPDQRKIVANKLAQKTIPQLEEMAELLPAQNQHVPYDGDAQNYPSYYGLAGGPSTGVVANAASWKDEQGLEAPTINWKEADPAKAVA